MHNQQSNLLIVPPCSRLQFCTAVSAGPHLIVYTPDGASPKPVTRTRDGCMVTIIPFQFSNQSLMALCTFHACMLDQIYESIRRGSAPIKIDPKHPLCCQHHEGSAPINPKPLLPVNLLFCHPAGADIPWSHYIRPCTCTLYNRMPRVTSRTIPLTFQQPYMYAGAGASS